MIPSHNRVCVLDVGNYTVLLSENKAAHIRYVADYYGISMEDACKENVYGQTPAGSNDWIWIPKPGW